jgi:two-component system LytT family response regulator
MQALKVILIDDEKLSLDVLEWELEGLDVPIEILAKCNDPYKGIGAIESLKPDLVFLDIEMPRLNGIQLLKKLDKIDFHLIFCTAYDQYAIEAIKNEALDYLLKPVQKDELEKAINKVKNKQTDSIQKRFLSLYEKMQTEKQDKKKVIIPTSDGLEFVDINDVIRCESESNYTSIYIKDSKKIFIAKTLKEVHAMLESDKFQRVHKSHLVNFDYIKRYLKSDGGRIVMEDGSEIPVSRSKKGDFFDSL